MKRIFIGVVLLLVVVVGAGGVFFALKKPAQRPASLEKVEVTAERVERGKYLVEAVLQCLHCHTEPNPTRWTARGDVATGAGGLCWDDPGLGTLCSSNITPDPETGLGSWTDGEIMRAVREGVSRDGRALFPIMNYEEYRQIPDEDMRAVVAYLRVLPPVKRQNVPAALKPPLNIIVKFIPKPLTGPVPPVAKTNPVAYGQYLSAVASCKTCHSPVDDKHHIIAGKEFSGGFEVKVPKYGIALKSPNITPHATGLGDRTKESFVGMFRSFVVPELQHIKVEPSRNTLMPWFGYAQMTDADLGAIYAYLKTVPPVESSIPKIAPLVVPPPPAAN